MTLPRRLFILGAMLVAVGAITMYVLTRPDVAELSVEAVSGPRPRITPPRIQHVPNIAIAKPVGWTGNARPVAAAGLSVNAFAANLDHPRWLYELPNGDVLVAESNSPARKKSGIVDYVMSFLMNRAGAGSGSANRITLLRDADGDGTAELKTPFITGLDSPFGMTLVRDRLYVANHDALVVYPFTTGVTRITARPQKIIALPGGGNHWTKNIVASPDGKLLYVAVGSTSNIGDNGIEREDKRAAIWEVSPSAKTMRIYASGLRNPVGMAWEPKSQALWAVVNERDMLGPDVPPDYMTRVDFGAFYGWPYSYWGGYEDKRVDSRPDLLEYTRRPDYALGPHTASLGLAFGALGPFRNGMFVGQHGSWNRQPPSGYKIAFVPFGVNGFPNGPMRDVLTGFLNAKGQAQGRPVGVLVDKRGSLLVADDVGNRIWRVAAKRLTSPISAR